MATPIVPYITAAAQLGAEAIRIKPKRSLGPFTAQVTLEETHNDDLEITEHPVEQGARMTDHSFMRPASLILHLGWSNSQSAAGLISGLTSIVNDTIRGVQSMITGNSPNQVKEVYSKLLELQKKREPFDVFTGKRVYNNMLIKSLSVSTDAKTEHSLLVTAHLQQILIVTTRTLTVTAPPDRQRYQEVTDKYANGGNKQLMVGSNYNYWRGRP